MKFIHALIGLLGLYALLINILVSCDPNDAFTESFNSDWASYYSWIFIAICIIFLITTSVYNVNKKRLQQSHIRLSRASRYELERRPPLGPFEQTAYFRVHRTLWTIKGRIYCIADDIENPNGDPIVLPLLKIENHDWCWPRWPHWPHSYSYAIYKNKEYKVRLVVLRDARSGRETRFFLFKR